MKMKKIGRNDPCPCGSGLKFKKCCIGKETVVQRTGFKETYHNRYGIDLKEQKDIDKIREAGRLVVQTLDMVETHIRPGITTDYINSLVHDFTIGKGATPAPLNYLGFPKSVCTSINEVVCHGIPGNRILLEGDIVNVDVTSILGGYFADANKTYFVGTPGADAEKIVRVSRRCLKKAIAMVKPQNTIGDIGAAIQEYAEGEGCSVVEEFVGHGVGFKFHEAPQVPHFGKRGEGIILVPGMVFTIEPMINLGEKHLHCLKDKWTIVTNDGSLSAQFEQTLVVTESGHEILTPFNLDES